MKKVKLRRLAIPVLLFVFLIIITPAIYAQPEIMSTPKQSAPIDGGLSILAAAGGAYAIKKLKNEKQE